MAARALLSRCIDYAGLFPPAGLDVETAMENYGAYRAGPDAWALGRLVLPTGRYIEFAERDPARAAEWPTALLVGAEFEAELGRAQRCGTPLEVVECKPASPARIAAYRSVLPETATLYCEVPTNSDPDALIGAIADAGGRAKIRTGGTTADAIPSVSGVARFLACCVRRHVPFKATAGLHHAVRANRALTYNAESDRATMHGFVNVILATAVLRRGGDTAAASALLGDETPENFSFDDKQAHWRDWSFPAEEIRNAREQAMVGFGSCSFTEPMEEMKSLGWLG